uniref:Uncharacterized protein n=1 Tax=Cucumis melo TaxID=3656 RepID=A0A9I9E9L1_CUCME
MAGIMKKIQETVQSHKKQHDGENGAEGVGIVEKMKEKIHGYKEKNKEKKKERKEKKRKREGGEKSQTKSRRR